MDLFIYIIMLALIGVIKINRTSGVSDSVGMVESLDVQIEQSSLPVASNLGLIREPGAYTAILKELGLIR